MKGKRRAFVLRIWHEDQDFDLEAESDLRGSLQEANSDDIHYFSSLSQFLKVLCSLVQKGASSSGDQ